MVDNRSRNRNKRRSGSRPNSRSNGRPNTHHSNRGRHPSGIDVATLLKIGAVILSVCVVAVVAKTVVVRVVDSPKSVIERLEDSYNDKSLNDMIDCFDPASQSLIEGFVGVFEEVSGVDNLVDIADGLLAISQIVDDEDFEDIQNSWMDLIPYDVQRDGDTAIVYFTMKIYDGDELIAEEDDALPVVKVDGTWYIDGTYIMDSIY